MAQQLWVTDSLGGFLGNAKLSKQLRFAAQPLMKFRQFVQIKGALGKNRNDTLYFNKVKNVGTAGGTLIETDTIPETEFTIGRGTLTITEYGNSVPYTGKLEALAEFDVDNAVTVSLRNDMAKVLDLGAADQFYECELKYFPASSSTFLINTHTDGSAANGTETGTGNLNDFHVKQCIDELKKGNVEPYDGNDYICIASVNALRGVKDSGDWTDAAKYGDPERLFSGEVGRFYNCRFIEENHVLSNTQADGSTNGEAIFFGADAVMEGVAVPEELRAKVPTDYGRSRGVAWYFLGGWKKIWDVTNDTEPHIIHFNPV